jgi:hypothetical protein
VLITGKSYFVEVLAHTAIEADLRVNWFALETLAAAVGRAKADGAVARTVARGGRPCGRARSGRGSSTANWWRSTAISTASAFGVGPQPSAAKTRRTIIDAMV